jgi:hypothetical protein
MTTLSFTVRLIGTDRNPFHRWGLTQNPFPEIPNAEFQAGLMAINSLGGDPITGPDDIRRRLAGRCSAELIELCVARFRPGEHVEFAVTFPYGGDDDRVEGAR